MRATQRDLAVAAVLTRPGWARTISLGQAGLPATR